MHDSIDSITSRGHSLRCPFCEISDLEPSGHDAARCSCCGGSLSGELLKILRQITDLPDVIGSHACECGHPEMRRLPDGVFHCPACGSEVLPISRSS
jgi:ribosomal protein L37AE/L43A